MVAITVILAAVIGSLVMGFGDNINQNVQAGASITSNGDTATVTYTANQTDGATLEISTSPSSEVTVSGDGTIDSVGSSVTVTNDGSARPIQITVTAVHDGTQTVVAQQTVSLEGSGGA